MRVVHIESGRHLYGGARQVLYLLEGLRREGVHNVLLCTGGSEIAAAAANLDSVEIVELPMRGELDIGAVRRLGPVLQACRPDIVHVHSRRGADLYGGLASVGRPWRAVLTRRVDSREWPPWARLKYRPYSAFVALSRAIETELVEHLRLPRARVYRVPSGVDTERFRPEPSARAMLAAELGLPPDAIALGVVAQLIPRKGHGFLLEVLPELLPRHPRARVLFFGRGPLERRLQAEIERRRLADRVVMAGFRRDLGRLLPGLDVVLHPACAEGLGLAVLEAMSAGIPVAAAAVGGLPDLLDDGVDGLLLLPPRDRQAWAVGVDRLLSDPGARTRMGAAARRSVEARFTARRMAAGNLDVYRAVLTGTAPAPAPLAAARTDRETR